MRSVRNTTALITAVLMILIAAAPVAPEASPDPYPPRGAPLQWAALLEPATPATEFLCSCADARVIEDLASASNPGLSPEERLEFVRAVIRSSDRHQVDPFLVASVIEAESRFVHRLPNGRINTSPDGCRGAMQLHPRFHQASDDLSANIDEGTAYLVEQLRRFDSLDLALAAYNAGPSVAETAVMQYKETREYVRRVEWTYWGLCNDPRRAGEQSPEMVAQLPELCCRDH